jgi:hypothetical protein
VVIQVWGRHERCDLETVKTIIRPFMPRRPANAPPDPDLSVPGAVERLAAAAGLTPVEAFDVKWAYEFPDDEVLARALVAPAGVAVVAGAEHEDELKAAIVANLRDRRDDDGRYRLENEFRVVIARA